MCWHVGAFYSCTPLTSGIDICTPLSSSFHMCTPLASVIPHIYTVCIVWHSTHAHYYTVWHSTYAHCYTYTLDVLVWRCIPHMHTACNAHSPCLSPSPSTFPLHLSRSCTDVLKYLNHTHTTYNGDPDAGGMAPLQVLLECVYIHTYSHTRCQRHGASTGVTCVCVHAHILTYLSA